MTKKAVGERGNPIIKWVGSKKDAMDKIVAFFPRVISNYHEPFVGGGNMLLYVLQLARERKIDINEKVYASDINEDLINMYKHIQAEPAQVQRYLQVITDVYRSIDHILDAGLECVFLAFVAFLCLDENWAHPFLSQETEIFSTHNNLTQLLSSAEDYQKIVTDFRKEYFGEKVLCEKPTVSGHTDAAHDRDSIKEISKQFQIFHQLKGTVTNYKMESRENFYNLVRKIYNVKPTGKGEGDIVKSALFIFLNRTCFRGLYRVNKKGQFNVSFGNYKSTDVFDRVCLDISIVSEYIQGVKFSVCDFEDSLKQVKKGDTVYLDPPYLAIDNMYVGYCRDGFGLAKAHELFEILLKAPYNFYLSNSNTQYVKDIFFDEKYQKMLIYTKTSIHKKLSKQKVTELLIYFRPQI